MATKRLHRSTGHKMLAGVCGGIAEYFELDATLIRLAWVFLSIFTAGFPGILLYIIAWIIIPTDRLVIE